MHVETNNEAKTEIKRCKNCNLPSNYPGIKFDKDGVCSICKKKEKVYKYKGIEELKKEVQKILKNSDENREYDCVVGYSGGRDSSYLLYFAKNVLKLRVLAITLEHDFMPEQTKKNIENLANKLGVEVRFIKNNALNKSGRQCVRAWANKPDPAMCATFCTGCRYGIKKLIPKYAREHNIPILLVGNTPYENINYRVNLLCGNYKKFTKTTKIKGYAKKLFQNPTYLLSPSSMHKQLLDFISYEGKKKKNVNPVTIKPFYSYIEWKEDEVIPTIQKFGWEYDKTLNSSWRSDCFANLLRQYYYKRMLGFNDLDVYYARLIRIGKISKQDAIKKIEEEGKYEKDVIEKILKEYYNLNYQKIDDKIEKYLKRN